MSVYIHFWGLYSFLGDKSVPPLVIIILNAPSNACYKSYDSNMTLTQRSNFFFVFLRIQKLYF